MCGCDGAGQQQNAPTASAAASEASSAPDAMEQTAETPVEGRSSMLTSLIALGKVLGCALGRVFSGEGGWGGGSCVLLH